MYSADTWRGRAHSALPYVSALFYVEIMLLVLFINFLYGRPAAVITGIILTVMLTVHVRPDGDGNEQKDSHRTLG